MRNFGASATRNQREPRLNFSHGGDTHSYNASTTLRSKQTEIIASIANYEKKIAQARADLTRKTAMIAIFEASGEIEEMPPYVDIHRCFKRGEAISLCKEALASGPLNTRQLASKVVAAKGLDKGDKVLARPIVGRLIHALRQQCRRGLIYGTEKHLGARVWALPEPRRLISLANNFF